MSYNSFICFSNNKGVGGLLANRIYSSLEPYCDNLYFSSAKDRVYGANYREEELSALNDAQFFILVLTNELVDGLKEGSETLFEIRKALELSLKIVPVAESSFVWTKKRIKKITQLLSETDANFISKIDYICFLGIREYEKLTEPELLRALGIEIKNTIDQSLVEIKNNILRSQTKKLYSDDNVSIIGNELLYFQRSFFFEPQKRINGLVENDSIINDVLDCINRTSSETWVVLGEIGCGKTTLMRKSYLSVTESSCDNACLPLYIRASEIKTTKFNKEALLCEHLRNMGIYYPETTIKRIIQHFYLCFFIDAIDEVPQTDYLEVSKMLNQRSSDCFYIFSCRKNVFQYYQIKGIDTTVEIMGPTVPQKKQIVDSFFEIEKIQNEQYKAAITETIVNNEIFNNILFVVMFLMFVKEEKQFFIPQNRFELMEKIMRWIIYREKEKKNCMIEETVFFRILERISMAFLRNKNLGEKIQFNELMFEVVKNEDVELNQSLITVFLVINPITNICHFAHEQFYEFLIAKSFVDLLNKNLDISTIVSFSFSIETNQMITEVFQGRNRLYYFQQLKKAYENVTPNDYRSKLFILNHMHRTSLYSEIKEFVVKLFERIDNDIDRILLLHSLLVAGDKNDEEFYYRELQSNERFALLNASITLSYYYGISAQESFPTIDDGSRSWYPVFIGYKNHIQKRFVVPHYNKVLRINLFTAKTFIKIRRRVDRDIANFFLSINNDLESDNSETGKEIYCEYRDLCSIINNSQII